LQFFVWLSGCHSGRKPFFNRSETESNSSVEEEEEEEEDMWREGEREALLNFQAERQEKG
jgi:hypothetical protein